MHERCHPLVHTCHFVMCYVFQEEEIVYKWSPPAVYVIACVSGLNINCEVLLIFLCPLLSSGKPAQVIAIKPSEKKQVIEEKEAEPETPGGCGSGGGCVQTVWLGCMHACK